MSAPPLQPRIFHITHVNNLADMARLGALWSDAKRLEHDLACELVGMPAIKLRRVMELPVSCHPDTRVGEYVPFYFCPRSIMLYILHMGNHPDLDYREGQRPIVHLVADLNATVAWSNSAGVRWAFTTRNAGTFYTQFFNDLRQLDQVDWNAVRAIDFRTTSVRDGKQAEFLVYDSFPWHLIDAIGVIDREAADQVKQRIYGAPHQPPIQIERKWYY